MNNPKRFKPPTGIPKSMLMTTPDGSYSLPGRAVAVLQPNEAAFEKEIEIPTLARVATVSTDLLPENLRCPLYKEIMKDAVLTSKCCFNSFCDKCISICIVHSFHVIFLCIFKKKFNVFPSLSANYFLYFL